MVVPGNRGNLPIWKAHREAELLSLAHQFSIDASSRLIESKYALVESQSDEPLKAFSKPRSTPACLQDSQAVSDLANGDR